MEVLIMRFSKLSLFLVIFATLIVDSSEMGNPTQHFSLYLFYFF